MGPVESWRSRESAMRFAWWRKGKNEAQAELAAATRLLQSQREARQKELYGTLPHPELTNVPQ